MLSEKIRDLRRKSGLSQEELAEKLDVSRQAVSKWETGAAVPIPEKLVELSDFFGVTLDFLMRENAAEDIGGSGVSENSELSGDIPNKTERFSRKKRTAVGRSYWELRQQMLCLSVSLPCSELGTGLTRRRRSTSTLTARARR